MAEARARSQPRAWLEELAELPRAGVSSTSEERAALRLCGSPESDSHGLRAGDVVVVAVEADAEVGDLVVWWTGGPHSFALAEVGEGYRLLSVAGFSAPRITGSGAAQAGQLGASVFGVVVARLRQVGWQP